MFGSIMTKPIIITSGEPAGVGIELCLQLANHPYNWQYQLAFIGDYYLFQSRAIKLGLDIKFNQLNSSLTNFITQKNTLNIYHINCPKHDCLGVPQAENASYVLGTLNQAISFCQLNLASKIVTAPIAKDIINKGLDIKFSGHTEYFAEQFNVPKVVMMLANSKMKVALLTTHIPLSQVSQEITTDNLTQTLEIIHRSFKNIFNISHPKIAICGLNPHAGENGYLGNEEIEIINPVIKHWQAQGYNISGSHSADTIFNHASEYDLILAMYHDQGLPVLKYSGFEDGINITLGLPILRSSVDHGTALDLAGTGKARANSLIQAIKFAISNN